MSVILYILDALRADHLSCYGYKHQTSSNQYFSVRDKHWKYIQIKRPSRNSRTLFQAFRHAFDRGMSLGPLDMLGKPKHFVRLYFGTGADILLFNLIHDPNETENLAITHLQTMARFPPGIETFLRRSSHLATRVGKSETDATVEQVLKKHLERFGYLWVLREIGRSTDSDSCALERQ